MYTTYSRVVHVHTTVLVRMPTIYSMMMPFDNMFDNSLTTCLTIVNTSRTLPYYSRTPLQYTSTAVPVVRLDLL